MPCNVVKMPDGGTAIVCSRGRRAQPRCAECREPAGYLCDWPMGPEGKTCDRPICGRHAKEVSTGIHYCGEHHRAWLASRYQGELDF